MNTLNVSAIIQTSTLRHILFTPSASFAPYFCKIYLVAQEKEKNIYESKKGHLFATIGNQNHKLKEVSVTFLLWLKNSKNMRK